MKDSKHKKALLLVFSVLLIIGLGFSIFLSKQDEVAFQPDYKNATYIIDGQSLTLQDGIHETEVAPDSASKITTRYFGNELTVDLNNDSREDVVFLITQDTGGSGVFYYAVAALNTEDEYKGSEAYLIGDRISPQTTELSQNPNHKNVIIINYADRALDEPMSTPPSVGKSIWLKLDTNLMQFGEVEKNFEGEADLNDISLTSRVWSWTETIHNDGRRITPNEKNDFIITFNEAGTFNAQTDCNNMSGNYVVNEDSISFGPVVMTKMFCPNSKETDFSEILENTSKFYFSNRGDLILDMGSSNGKASFQPLNNPNQTTPTMGRPYNATLSGEYVCLPHKNADGPQTMECMYGLKTTDGNYYGIDFYLMSKMHEQTKIGQIITARGVVQSADQLQSTTWQKYNITGVLSVTEILQVE